MSAWLVPHNPLRILNVSPALDSVTVANGTVSVGVMSAVVDGGFPPYTHSWFDTSAGSPYFSNGGSATVSVTTAFASVESVGTNTIRNGVFVYTLGDSRGDAAVVSVTVCVIHGSP